MKLPSKPQLERRASQKRLPLVHSANENPTFGRNKGVNEEGLKVEDKLNALRAKLEIRQAEKKGAVSIKMIIISGLLLSLAVGIVVAFIATGVLSGIASNKVTATAANKSTTQATANQTQTSGSVTAAP